MVNCLHLRYSSSRELITLYIYAKLKKLLNVNMTHIPYLCWELKVLYTGIEKNTWHANVFDFAASHSFPYMKKRIEVVKKTDSVLHPIEVAIDEMQSKVVDIREVVNLSRPDLKKLQLRLQGSVSAQVNTSVSLSVAPFLSLSLSLIANDSYIW